MHALKADTYRVFGRLDWWLPLKGMLLHPTLRVVISVRLCQAAQRSSPALRWLLLPLARVVHRLACQIAGIELPWQAEELQDDEPLVGDRHSLQGLAQRLLPALETGADDDALRALAHAGIEAQAQATGLVQLDALAPRFLASAFASGPALLILLCLALERFTSFRAGEKALRALQRFLRRADAGDRRRE